MAPTNALVLTQHSCSFASTRNIDGSWYELEVIISRTDGARSHSGCSAERQFESKSVPKTVAEQSLGWLEYSDQRSRP